MYGTGARHLKDGLRDEPEPKEELLMGAPVSIEITKGDKVIAVLDEDGIPMTNATKKFSGGQTKIGLPDYYLPQANFCY